MAFSPLLLAFTLPVGTPGNALAYSSGYLRLRDMLVPGSLMVLRLKGLAGR